MVGDILGIIFFRSNFLLAMVLNIGIPTGLAPLVYLYGAKGISVFASRKIHAVKTKQNSQKKIFRIVSSGSKRKEHDVV